MKKLMLFASLLVTSQGAFANTNVVYGQDNRKDLFEVTDAAHLKMAQSTAGMIPGNLFVKASVPGFFDLINLNTLEVAENLCTNQKFAQQSLAPICSGFLVGPDTIVTAGHCYNSFDKPENVCKNFVWVFNYEIATAGSNPAKNISVNNLYLCKSVVASYTDQNYDFSIIKLDRKVVGREPLKFRTAGKIDNSARLVVIGHPNGLPKKVGTGKINYNNEPTRFSTNLDTFHGNSGAAVFDATTGMIEGILIMGKNDYRPSIPANEKSCKLLNVCDDMGNNCSGKKEDGTVGKGEVVLRISVIASMIAKALAL